LNKIFLGEIQKAYFAHRALATRVEQLFTLESRDFIIERCKLFRQTVVFYMSDFPCNLNELGKSSIEGLPLQFGKYLWQL